MAKCNNYRSTHPCQTQKIQKWIEKVGVRSKEQGVRSKEAKRKSAFSWIPGIGGFEQENS
jgi:hypothetical protein